MVATGEGSRHGRPLYPIRLPAPAGTDAGRRPAERPAPTGWKTCPLPIAAGRLVVCVEARTGPVSFARLTAETGRIEARLDALELARHPRAAAVIGIATAQLGRTDG